MPLSGIHFLLSYQCTHECDHCFVWSSPRAGGTMSIETLIRVLDQAQAMGTVKNIYFEGGEPFLFYPVLVEGIRQARVALRESYPALLGPPQVYGLESSRSA